MSNIDLLHRVGASGEVKEIRQTAEAIFGESLIHVCARFFRREAQIQRVDLVQLTLLFLRQDCEAYDEF